MATGIVGTTSTASTQSSNQPDSLTKGAGGALGKDQFLKLLVAQMKNQDPLNPMDGQQMAAQLAQFSSVEQLTQINETLQSQGTGQTGLATLLAENGALGAVGKTVVVSAAAVDTTKASPSSLMADIPEGATSAMLKVYDADGNEVASQDLGSVSEGRKTFSLNSKVTGLAGGTYKYVVEAANASGTKTNASTYLTGTVGGVRFSTSGPIITIGGVAVPYMSVTEIGA